MQVAERARALVRNEPWSVLTALVVAQWIAVAIFAVTVRHNGWIFYQGGDQTWFSTSGWILANGHVPETLVGWVLAFAMTPLAAVAGPSFLAMVPAVVIFQYVFVLPLGVLCAYGIASRIGGRWLGYWTAAWWVVAPYAVIELFVDRYHDTYVEQVLPQALGLTGLGDFPSMIAVLCSAFFVVRALESGARVDVVAAGLLAGLAIGIKPANGLFALAPLVAFALARRPRAGLDFALALVPALVTLAAWKYKGSGIALLAAEPIRLAVSGEVPDFSPPTFWERVRDYVPVDPHQLNQQFLGFREYFWSARVLEFVPVAGLVAVARRSVPVAGLLGVWLAAYFVVKGSSEAVNVETGSIWRLLMPAWPAYFLLGAALPLLVPRVGRAIADRYRSAVAPLGLSMRTLLAIGAALFAIPMLLFLALPSDKTARAAIFEQRSLYVPIDPDLQPRGRALGDGTLRITVPKPDTLGVRPFYVLLRSPRRYVFPGTDDVVTQGIRCRRPGHADRCTVEMEEVSRARSPLFREHPAAGDWTYRVGVAANWLDDIEGGDILVLSEPFDVASR